MNFEPIDGTYINGDAKPRVRAMMAAQEQVLPSDAGSQDTNVRTATAAVTVPDDRYKATIKWVEEAALTVPDARSLLKITKLDELLTLLDSTILNFVLAPHNTITTKSETLTVPDDRFTMRDLNRDELSTLIDQRFTTRVMGRVETPTLTDVRAFTLIKSVVETLTTLDSTLTVLLRTKRLDELLTLLDQRLLTQRKWREDALVIFSEYIKNVIIGGAGGNQTRVSTENLVVRANDLLRKVNVILATGVTTLYDQDRTFSWNIRTNDAIASVENFVYGINLKPGPLILRVVENDIKIYHSFLTKEYSRLVVDELLTLADDYPYWVMRFARMLDSMDMTDSTVLHKISPIQKYVLTESMALDATFILRKLRVYTENLTVSDANQRKTNVLKVDTALTPVDAFIKAGFIAGVIKARVAGESVVLSDGTQMWEYDRREVIDPLTMSDSVIRARVLMQQVTEAATLADTIIKAFGPLKYIKIQDEGIVLVDSTNAVRYVYRRAEEGLALGDIETDSLYAVRVPSDNIAVVDSTGQGRLLPRVQAEALALTDSSIAASLRQVNLIESLALIDPFTRYEIQARIAAEGLTITDEQLQRLLRYRVVSEAAILNDSQILALAKLRSMTESVTVQDGVVSVRVSRAVLAELLGLTDEALAIDNVYVTLTVRVTVSATPSPVLGVDNLAVLSGDNPIKVGG